MRGLYNLPSIDIDPKKSRTGFFKLIVFPLIATLLVNGCGGGDENSNAQPVTPVTQKSSLYAEINTASATALVGKTVAFKANVAVQNTTVRSYRWTSSDGQTGTDSTFSAAFAAPVTVTLQVTAADGTVAQSTTSVFVSNTASAINQHFDLPPVFGDVTSNASVDILDVLVIAQGLSGRVPLDTDQNLAVDIDLDGAYTEKDLKLVMDAVLAGAKLPSTALVKTGLHPNSVFAVISPALLAMDNAATFRLNGTPIPTTARAIPGYATLLVPSKFTGFGTDLPLDISVGGAVVDSIRVAVSAVQIPNIDPKEDVANFFAQWKAGIEKKQASLRSFMASGDLTAAEQNQLLLSGQAAASMVDTSAAKVQEALSQPGGEELAKAIQSAMYANGLVEFRALLDSIASPSSTARAKAAISPDDVCDRLIPGLCGVKKTAELMSTAGTVVTTSCTVISGLLALTEIGAPAGVAIFLEACVPLIVIDRVATVTEMLTAPISPKLHSSAEKTSLRAGEQTKIFATVSFSGAEAFCKAGADGGFFLAGEAINKRYGSKIVGSLLQNNAVISRLAQVFAKIGEQPYQKLLELIQGSVTTALDRAGLKDGLEKLAGLACGANTFASLPVPILRVFTQPAADSGFIVSRSDGSGIYQCPPAGPVFKKAITLNGQLQLCTSPPDTTVLQMSCSTSTVTITMGDNGSALDDIFEVIVNDATVLTSAAPIRSTTASISLSSGRNTVTMRGLAAPDGIGTYFIQFGGATVVDGDAISGSDLSTGVVKQFVIEVP